MPAVRAASAFAPTARRRKPRVDRVSSHQQPTAAASARIRPECASSNRFGNRAELCTVREIASVEFLFWKPLTVSR